MTQRGDFSQDIASDWILGRQTGSILTLAGIAGHTRWTVFKSTLTANLIPKLPLRPDSPHQGKFAMASAKLDIEKLVSLCRRRGFI